MACFIHGLCLCCGCCVPVVEYLTADAVIREGVRGPTTAATTRRSQPTDPTVLIAEFLTGGGGSIAKLDLGTGTVRRVSWWTTGPCGLFLVLDGREDGRAILFIFVAAAARFRLS